MTDLSQNSFPCQHVCVCVCVRKNGASTLTHLFIVHNRTFPEGCTDGQTHEQTNERTNEHTAYWHTPFNSV